MYSNRVLNGARKDICDYGRQHKKNAFAYLNITKKQILGANFGYEVVVPIVDKDVSIEALGVSDSKALSLGDVFFEPFVLVWHRPRWDATITLGVYAPTGEYDSQKPASPGLGYWLS